MRELNRENYQAWLLDRSEHRLSADELLQLEVFLINNPDLDEEMQPGSLEGVSLKPGDFTFPDHRKLLVQVEEEEIIALAEGDLPSGQAQLIQSKIDGTAAGTDLRLLQKARLQPDLRITFPDPAVLQKRQPVVRNIYYWSSAAAAVLVILILIQSLQTVYTPRPQGFLMDQHAELKESTLNLPVFKEPATVTITASKLSLDSSPENQKAVPEITIELKPAISVLKTNYSKQVIEAVPLPYAEAEYSAPPHPHEFFTPVQLLSSRMGITAERNNEEQAVIIFEKLNKLVGGEASVTIDKKKRRFFHLKLGRHFEISRINRE